MQLKTINKHHERMLLLPDFIRRSLSVDSPISKTKILQGNPIRGDVDDESDGDYLHATEH